MGCTPHHSFERNFSVFDTLEWTAGFLLPVQLQSELPGLVLRLMIRRPLRLLYVSRLRQLGHRWIAKTLNVIMTAHFNQDVCFSASPMSEALLSET